MFTSERDNAIVYEEKLFIAPNNLTSMNKDENIQHLKNAKTQEQWSYEQRMKELNDKEKKMNEIYDEKKKVLERDENDIAANLIKYIQNDAYGFDEPLSEEVSLLLL